MFTYLLFRLCVNIFTYFVKFLEFFISFRSPEEIWKNHPSYLILELVVYLCTLLTLIHALKAGGRFKYLWLATMLHGLTVEAVSYFVPDIDNFWHAQSMVMFLGRRLPLHIIFVYPFFIYTASAAAQSMNLSVWARPFAVGLGVVLIDLPFDIVGIKQLWWSWHDTDPNIYDRMYWVPWTSYYFHAAFASSVTIMLHLYRYIATGSHQIHHVSRAYKEVILSVLTGLSSMTIGIIQFVPIYHPFHDLLGVPTNVCVFIFLAVFAVIVWKSDRRQNKQSTMIGVDKCLSKILLAVVVIANASMFFILHYFDPSEIKSIGIHEETGPCYNQTNVLTPIGKMLRKRTYLCPIDYDEGYYDFHCTATKRPPKDYTRWYTICGTPYQNKAEYLLAVGSICLISTFIFNEIFKSKKQKESKKQK